MDTTALLRVLTTALEITPQAGDDLFWPLSQAAHEPSQADQRLVRLLEQLRKTPELEVFNNGWQVVANSGGMVSYSALAWWLLARARHVGAEPTLENLRDFLAASDLSYRMILALGGITLDSPCTVGQNITLLPWEKIPDSWGNREAIALLTGPGSFPNRPTAALVREITLPRQNVTQTEYQQGKHNFAPVDYTDLRDALLCIGLVGPVAPYELLAWLEPPEWAPILGVTLEAPFHEGSASSSQWPSGAAMQAQELCERFSRLSPSNKDLMRLRMQRLSSAMRRQNPVDAAIDLGITLESLFLNDTNEELSFRLRLRAARLLRQNYDDRVYVFNLVNDLYAVRSAAVHSGRLTTTNGFFTTELRKRLRSPYKSKPIKDLLKAGFALAAQAISYFLQTGEPDWNQITLA